MRYKIKKRILTLLVLFFINCVNNKITVEGFKEGELLEEGVQKEVTISSSEGGNIYLSLNRKYIKESLEIITNYCTVGDGFNKVIYSNIYTVTTNYNSLKYQNIMNKTISSGNSINFTVNFGEYKLYVKSSEQSSFFSLIDGNEKIITI